MPVTRDETTPGWLLLDAEPRTKQASPLARRLAWARSVCGVKPDATPEIVRSVLLRELKKNEFVPGEDFSQACRVLHDELQGAALADDPPICALATEHTVKAEIDRFAGEFFELPAGVRFERWEQLSRVAADYPLQRARLEQWEPAIDVDPRRLAGNADSFHRRLADYLCELFALRPAARATRRAELIEQFVPQRDEWKAAAEFLARNNRDIARLDPNFVGMLVAPPAPVSRAPYEPVIAAGTGSNSYYSQYSVTQPGLMTHAKPQYPQYQTTPRPSLFWTRNYGWLFYVAIGIFFVICFIAGFFNGGSPRNSPSRNSPYLSPNYSPQPIPDEALRKIIEDIRRAEEEGRPTPLSEPSTPPDPSSLLPSLPKKGSEESPPKPAPDSNKLPTDPVKLFQHIESLKKSAKDSSPSPSPSPPLPR